MPNDFHQRRAVAVHARLAIVAQMGAGKQNLGAGVQAARQVVFQLGDVRLPFSFHLFLTPKRWTLRKVRTYCGVYVALTLVLVPIDDKEPQQRSAWRFTSLMLLTSRVLSFGSMSDAFAACGAIIADPGRGESPASAARSVGHMG